MQELGLHFFFLILGSIKIAKDGIMYLVTRFCLILYFFSFLYFSYLDTEYKRHAFALILLLL